MNNNELFEFLFMMKLESELNKVEFFKSISFHLGKANTDIPLLIVLKDFIISKLQNIKKEGFNLDYINETKINWNFVESIEVTNVVINDLETNNGKAFQSDLQIICTSDIEFPIEVKSTKNNVIPGSSVQQINPFVWVIFIKHEKDYISIQTGRYLDCINKTIRFPDRSPRPEVSFNTLKEWNFGNRTQKDTKLIWNTSKDLDKLKIINNWQEVMIDDWFNRIIDKNECTTWFDHCLNGLAIKLISYFKSLDEEELAKKEISINKKIDE